MAGSGGRITVQDDHNRFLIDTSRDDRAYTVARSLRDDSQEVILTQRDDLSGLAVDAIQEDADVVLLTVAEYTDLEELHDMDEQLDELGGDDIYVAADNPRFIESADHHVDATYCPNDDLDDIVDDLYRPLDWQYVDGVGPASYEALEDADQPRYTEGDELEDYLADAMDERTARSVATKIEKRNPAIFD